MTCQIQEFVSSILIILEGTKHGAGHGDRILLFHAAHDHAKMLGFDDDRHATRMDFLFNRFSNLRRQSLLNLKSPGVHIHEPRYLAQADDAAVWNLPHMAFAEERKQMMLAQTEQLDVPNDDHFVVGNVEHCLVQKLVGVHLVAAGQESQCAIHAPGGVQQTIAIRVFADLGQNRPDLFNHQG